MAEINQDTISTFTFDKNTMQTLGILMSMMGVEGYRTRCIVNHCDGKYWVYHYKSINTPGTEVFLNEDDLDNYLTISNLSPLMLGEISGFMTKRKNELEESVNRIKIESIKSSIGDEINTLNALIQMFKKKL